MSTRGGESPAAMVLDTAAISAGERYQLLTSLVVPRPIGWISTRSAEGAPNLAPFSYFAAISPTPMLVAVSIGSRRGEPKDTLRNIRETGEFCANIVTERRLRSMVATSGEYPPDVDEFVVAGVPMAGAARVAAPYVADAPAVLECRLFKEVPLEGSANTLVIGEVVAVRLSEELEFEPGTRLVTAASLRPVGRMGGERYAPPGAIVEVPRPPADAPRASSTSRTS